MVTHAKEEKKQNKQSPNRTGIPDKMKSKFESFSGFSFSDVRVHYNSDKPVQLQALAYTQGNQVYVAPRQERYLEHELGHVVQQKKGLVKPTKRLQGMELNDDEDLERDADVMSKKSLSLDSEKVFNLQDSFPTSNIVQGILYGKPGDAKTLIEKQIELQKKSEDEIAEKVKADNPDDEGAYTTVGFEHEFASIGENEGKLNLLSNLTHVELAESSEKLGFTELPFKLETDSNDTIELVGAPFIISTTKENPIPNSDDVNKVDDLMNHALKKICKSNPSFKGMKDEFKEHMGLSIEYKNNILIKAHNFNPGANKTSSDNKINESDFIKLTIQYGSKGNPNGSTQINFATNAFVYDVANDAFPRQKYSSNKEYIDKQASYWDTIKEIKGDQISPNVTIFLKELAKNLSQINAVKYQKELNEKKEILFTPIEDTKESKESEMEIISTLSQKEKSARRDAFSALKIKYRNAQETFNDSRSKSGWVKDANTFWLKDTLYNFGIGILNKSEWQRVRYICDTMKDNGNFKGCEESLVILIKKIDELLDSSSPIAEQPKISFGEHDPQFLGARQDTFLSLAGKKRPPYFKDETFHLVEMRSTDNFKEKLDIIKQKSIEKQLSVKTSLESMEQEKIPDLLLENQSKEYSFKITYESQKKEIKIIYSGNSRIKTTTIPVSDLSNSKIECEKDKELYNISIQGPSLTYTMKLTENQGMQFIWFIDKVLKPFNFKKSMDCTKDGNTK